MEHKQKLWQRGRGMAPEEKSTSHLERVVLSSTHTLLRAHIFLGAYSLFERAPRENNPHKECDKLITIARITRKILPQVVEHHTLLS